MKYVFSDFMVMYHTVQACMHTYTFTLMRACMHTNAAHITCTAQARARARTHTHTHSHTQQLCIYPQVKHIRTHTHTYTCTPHTHTHTHTHTYTCTPHTHTHTKHTQADQTLTEPLSVHRSPHVPHASLFGQIRHFRNPETEERSLEIRREPQV